MKRADKPVVTVKGDNNKVRVLVVNLDSAPAISMTVIIAVVFLVLIVARCCPEEFKIIVRWAIDTLLNS